MRVPLRVDNRIRVASSAVNDEARTALIEAFTHRNPKHDQMMSMGYSTRNEPREIATWGEDRGELSFPRGGMQRVREVLRQHGHVWDVQDARCVGDAAGRSIPDGLQEPWPFQLAGVAAMEGAENCIVRAPTGGGKTSLAITFVSRMKRAALFMVWNGGLYDQWRARLQKELGLRARDIGEIRGGKWKLAPVTVAMQQSLSSRGLPREVDEYFGCIVVDEVQRAAASTMYRAVDAFSARYRIGISADERRKDKKDFITRDLFGDVRCDIDRDKLVAEGFILDVEVRVVPTAFRAPWYGHPLEGGVLDNNRLLDEMCNDEDRNELGLGFARAEVAAGEQVLMLSHRVEHCHALARALISRGVPCGYMMGGAENRVEFQRSVTRLTTGEIRVGIGTYGALGTGIDIPRVGVAIAMTPVGSNRQFSNQVRGRVCRSASGKTSARFYNLWDAEVHPTHLGNFVKWSPTVRVFSGGEWLNGNQFERKRRAAAKTSICVEGR